MKLSIIIPVYNGAATIGPFVDRLEQALAEYYELEAVLINDASPSDNSAEVCAALATERSWIRFLDLSRNFGEHNAVMAGLNHCTGEAAVIMDDDLQTPPEEVVRLLSPLTQGYDVVYASYEKKKHSLWRNLGSRFNDYVATLMLDKPADLYLCSFKAINRFVIDEVTRFDGPKPYLDGLILRTTRNIASVQVSHHSRQEGSSGYTLHKLISLWLNMFTSTSIAPLRMATLLGFALAGLGLLGAVAALLEALFFPDMPRGWPSLMISMLLLSGTQLITLGLVGEYLGRLYLKSNGHPQFIIRNRIEPREAEDIARPHDGDACS